MRAPPAIPIGQAMARALELFEPVAAAVPHAAAPLNSAPAAAPTSIPSRLAGDIAHPAISDTAAAPIRQNFAIFRTSTFLSSGIRQVPQLIQFSFCFAR